MIKAETITPNSTTEAASTSREKCIKELTKVLRSSGFKNFSTGRSKTFKHSSKGVSAFSSDTNIITHGIQSKLTSAGYTVAHIHDTTNSGKKNATKLLILKGAEKIILMITPLYTKEENPSDTEFSLTLEHVEFKVSPLKLLLQKSGFAR